MLGDEYYLGIDGGGTKTAFLVVNQKNQVVFNKITGPSSLDTVSFEEFKNNIFGCLKDCHYKIQSVFAGIGGVSTSEQINNINAFLKTIPCCKDAKKIASGNDAVNALYGGLDGKDGVMLIAGTGSACFGKHKDCFIRTGGYCYQEGDPGSAYDLGKKALSHLAKVIDKRLPESDFSKMLMLETKCSTYEALASYFVKVSRTEVASLAKIVTSCPDDKYALKIIESAVKEALLMVSGCYNQLHFRGKTSFTIIGSLGNANTIYKKLLVENLKKVSNDLVYIPMKHEASYGSIIKAKEEGCL